MLKQTADRMLKARIEAVRKAGLGTELDVILSLVPAV
jgi:hypothetical protein